MYDRKEVMSWLEGLTDEDWQRYHSDSEVRNIAKAALELLKEQDPMRVLSQRECETLPNHYEIKGFCPKCHQTVEWLLNRSYCGFCGQCLEWK